MNRVLNRLLIGVLLSWTTIAFAGNVAIVKGNYYTTNLRDNLIAEGHNVSEIPNYTAR